jgi:hypothetical protein
MISGYIGSPLNLVERAIYGILAVFLILAPFGAIGKFVSIAAFAILLIWSARANLFGTGKPVAAGE